MEGKKYCKHCGELIDTDCVVCPKCGKQVETISGTQNSNPTIVINNSSSSSSSAAASAAAFAGGIGGTSISPKSKMITLILSIFLGYLGIHRFYVGKIGSGIVWMFTAGLFGIGWIYDIIKILSGTFTDGAGRVIGK